MTYNQFIVDLILSIGFSSFSVYELKLDIIKMQFYHITSMSNTIQMVKCKANELNHLNPKTLLQ